MATNLNLDDDLLVKAQEIGGCKTKRETVNDALREYIQRRERHGLIELIGTIDFDPDYDYKAERRRATEKGVRKATGK